MELWLDLLFGNPVGLLSVIVLSATLGVFVFIIWLFFKKVREEEGSKNQ